MFSRDHLVIGALGFVLGGVVTTASISTILLTQQKEEKICPPVTVAPQAITHSDITEPVNGTPPAPTIPPSAAPVEPKPIKAVAAPKTIPPVDTSKIKGIAGEEADKSLEDQKQLLARKQNLQSQLQDSDEIIRLKEQQIKEMEAKLQK